MPILYEHPTQMYEKCKIQTCFEIGIDKVSFKKKKKKIKIKDLEKIAIFSE